ncbi:MAG: NRDE family protein, partial [Myxococcales bacterium]|nr:NRDE family protein [Myxococcales bacterium]
MGQPPSRQTGGRTGRPQTRGHGVDHFRRPGNRSPDPVPQRGKAGAPYLQLSVLARVPSMCTLLISFQNHPVAPLVVAANRDELYARPTSTPVVLRDNPRAIGGKDLRFGGSWFGV